MNNLGFSYTFNKQVWCARFCGTVWKLTDEDIEAIKKQTWDTTATIVIKRTLDNRNITSIMARSLLNWEQKMVQRN